MSRTPARRSRTGAAHHKAIAESLSAREARALQRALLAAHPGLSAHAESGSREVDDDITIDDMAGSVEQAVLGLDEDEVLARAGSTQWGHTDPMEVAHDMIEEAVTSYLDDIRRLLNAGRAPAALRACKGVVLGLYRAHQRQRDPVIDWSPDSPLEIAADAVTLYRTHRSRRKRAGPRPKPRRVAETWLRATVQDWAGHLR